MSRVQLALRVSDLEGSVAFYAKLFGVEPAKRRPGYANFAVENPPLKLVLLEGEAGRPTVMDHLGVEVSSTDEVTAATRPPDRRRPDHPRGERHRVLLRPPGQGLGTRTGRRALGGLHGEGRLAATGQGGGERLLRLSVGTTRAPAASSTGRGRARP